jgi:hypothetical protein
LISVDALVMSPDGFAAAPDRAVCMS